MKRFLMTTAFVVATTGMAAAQDDAQIRAAVEQELATYNMEVDLDSLTEAQLSELYLIATSEDSASEKEQNILQVLGEENVATEGGAAAAGPAVRTRTYTVMEGDADVEPVSVSLPRNQLRSLVGQMLATHNIEADVMTLTDEQLAELYLIDTSSDSESTAEDRIRGVIGQ